MVGWLVIRGLRKGGLCLGRVKHKEMELFLVALSHSDLECERAPLACVPNEDLVNSKMTFLSPPHYNFVRAGTGIDISKA